MILDLEILISWPLNHLLVMHGASRPNGIDSSCFVVLIPRSAIFFPDGVFDPLLDVGVEGICYILLRRPGRDVLVLHLFDDVDGVIGDGVERSHHTAVFNWPGWSDEGDEVGEVGNSESEVGFGADLPFILCDC